MSLTSVIMVSYRTGEALFPSVEAVLRQTSPVELIVVDNGNPDDDIRRLRDVAAGDSRVTLLSGHGNIGFGRANNLGVKNALGDFVLILNPDCFLRADTVDLLLEHAAALPSPWMIGPRIVNEDGTDQRGCRRELLSPTSAFVEALGLGRIFPSLRLNRHGEEMPDRMTPVPAISGAFMFMPRKDFNLVCGFDEGYFLHVEDLDLCFRFRSAGGEIYFDPHIVVTHVGGTSEASSDFVERHKAKSFSRYFHSNFGNRHSRLFLACLDAAIWARYVLKRITKQRGSALRGKGDTIKMPKKAVRNG